MFGIVSIVLAGMFGCLFLAMYVLYKLGTIDNVKRESEFSEYFDKIKEELKHKTTEELLKELRETRNKDGY